MRIGVDIRALMTPHRTGVGEYTHELLTALFSLDKKNEYFLFYNCRRDAESIVPRWEQENVRYIIGRLPNSFLNFSLAAIGRPYLDKWISRETGVTLDYFFSPNLNFTALSPGVKHILTVHDLSFEFFPDCYSAKMRAWHRLISPRSQCARADIILAPSENTKRDIIDCFGVDEKKIKVIYPGLSVRYEEDSVADEATRRKYNLPERFILFLGTIEPRKNILGLIEAYKMLKIQTPLVIVGASGWRDKELKKIISITAGVRCLDYVSAKDKSVLYRLANVFVYPSLYEGFGFPVLEAMACGTPVITSSRSSLPEVAGDAACLVNPMNVNDIADAIHLLLNDKSVWQVYRERGFARAREFRWDIAAGKWLDLINGRV